MKVITSVDGGNSWGGSAVTGPAASHWPGVFNRDATHILALYSKDGLVLLLSYTSYKTRLLGFGPR